MRVALVTGGQTCALPSSTASTGPDTRLNAAATPAMIAPPTARLPNTMARVLRAEITGPTIWGLSLIHLANRSMTGITLSLMKLTRPCYMGNGSAACGERVGQYVLVSGVAGPLKQK